MTAILSLVRLMVSILIKDIDFLKEIGRLSQNRQDGQAACGAKDAGTD